jgi:cytochrome c biogenesis protein CcmG, thiol:disulfide interchange protein DsbE
MSSHSGASQSAAGASLVPRRLLAIVLAAAAVGLVAAWGIPGLASRAPAAAASQAAAPLEGAPAPDFSLSTVTGESMGIGDFRGRPVLINFWATWCEPCRLEMPAIQERYERFAPEGLQVLAVDYDEPVDDVAAFGKELGLSFPLLLDPSAEVQNLYQVRGYPSSYFVDRQGIIRAIQIGVMTEGQLDHGLSVLGLGG